MIKQIKRILSELFRPVELTPDEIIHLTIVQIRAL